MKVKLAAVRLAFPSLFEAKTVGTGEGDPRFSAAFVIEPGSANAKALAQAVDAVAKEKWKDKAGAILKELRGKGRVAYREEPLSKDGEVYDGFEGMHSLNASNKVRPLVINRDKSPLTAQDGLPYAGCYVNASIDIWAQDNSYGKRINCTLSGVQFARDGDAFGGGRPASADEFESIEEGADADALV
jgi:hypothetical protein